MFSFFNRRSKDEPDAIMANTGLSVGQSDQPLKNYPPQIQTEDAENAPGSPAIPEEIFVEYQKPKINEHMEPNDPTQEINNLQTLYRYLERNLEKQGYEDALTNPDSSYMQEQIRFTQNELNLVISKVNSYYSGFIRQIDFHIETRKRNGMVETVDELLTHKATIEHEMKIVSSIEESAKSGNGITENLFLGYKKGFRNGFAAITYNTVLRGKLDPH